MLTNKEGNDIGQFLYTPFGEMWVEEASTVDISHITRFFTNQQYDKESGLYYYNARYYDPHLGSFITPDPKMANLNHYAYASANPIKYSDPTGLLDEKTDETTTTPTLTEEEKKQEEEKQKAEEEAKKVEEPKQEEKKVPTTLDQFRYKNIEGNKPKEKKLSQEMLDTLKALTQKIDGKVNYPKACQGFAIIKAGIRAGYEPFKKGKDLADAVNKMVEDKKTMIEIIKTVFAKDIGDKKVYYDNIKGGLTAEQLKAEGAKKNSIGLLVYQQSAFWNINAGINDVHGVGFYNGTFIEPYLDTSGAFEQIRGSNKVSVSDYRPTPGELGSYFFYWK